MAMHEPADPRVAALEREVGQLRAQLAEARTGERPQATVRGSRGRSVLSALLVILACVLAPLSVVSVWARGEVTDTDRYVATVAPLASDPAVQQAVSDRVTARILDVVDIQALTSEAIGALAANRDLSERQQAVLTTLAGPLNSGVESFIGDKVNEIIASEAFAAAWTAANTKVHQQLNAALSGQDTGAVSLQGDQVVLDLGDVVAQVKQRLVDRGFDVAERIPTVDATMVLYQSDQIATAQTGYTVLNEVGFWLPFVALAIAIVGVLVANRRRVAVIGLGVGVALAMLVAGLALAFGRMTYLNALPDTVNTAAATTFFDAFTSFLRQALWAGVVAGLVVTLAGLLTGPSRFATGVRGTSGRAAAALQGQLASWGIAMDSVRRWVAAQATGLRIAATVAAVALVMVQRYKTVGLVLWTTVGLLVVLFIIQVLASGAPGSAATDDDEDAGPQSRETVGAGSPPTA